MAYNITHNLDSWLLRLQIVLGLRDADDELVAASLHCLGDLVSLIGADTVIGQGRMRIFSMGKPKVGTLVIIILMNIMMIEKKR